MSWLSDYKYRWYESLAMKIVKCGPIPRHIAFIMDGNRRFARSVHIEKIEGHTRGFDKLAECLRWCLDMGIKEVTTFAFSIENFRRSEDEVVALMKLAKEKFEKLLEESDKLEEHGVRIRVIGNINLLPPELQEVIGKAMLTTEQNSKLFLNIAFAYTSKEEITNSIETVLQFGDELESEDIDELLLEQCLYTRNSPEPDLLFRTSGESRISDFLMWQLTSTVLYFTKILWPQLNIWNFLCGIFSYQKAAFSLKTFKQQFQNQRELAKKYEHHLPERVQDFLDRVNAERRKVLLNMSLGKFKGK